MTQDKTTPSPETEVIAVISKWIRLYIFLEAHNDALGKVFTAEEDDPVCEKERQSCNPYEPIAVAERPIHFSATVAVIDFPNRFDCAALHHQSGCFDGFGQPVDRLAAQCQEIGKARQQRSPKLLRQILTDTISKLLLPFFRPHRLTPLTQTLRRAGEQSFADVAKAYSAPAPQPNLLPFAAGDPRRIVDIADQSRCKDERYIREEELPKRLPRNDLVLPETQNEYESHNDRSGDTDRSQDRDDTRDHRFCSSIYINLKGRRHLVQRKRLNWLIRGLQNGLTEPPAPQPRKVGS